MIQLVCANTEIRILPVYSDRQAWANSVDPDQTPQNAASDLGLPCLSLVQQLFKQTSL